MSVHSFFQSILWICFVCSISGAAVAESTTSKIDHRTLSFLLPGSGRAVVTLTTEKHFGAKTSSKFYQGEVRFHGATYPAAAATVRGVTKITFHGKKTGSRKSRQRLYTVELSKRSINIKSVPSSAIPHYTCAEHDSTYILQATPSSITTQEEEEVRIVTVATYADPEFVYAKGTASNDEIARHINVAEALYARQLGIRFKILEQSIFDTSTPEIQPGLVLDSFRSRKTPSDTNVQYLFTGKDLDGSTIGIAYVGAVCYEPTYAQGVVQLYGELTGNIFAHEVGHNLGAVHDVDSPGSIMYPSISFGEPYFSAKSVSDITSFVANNGQCLQKEQMPPSLVNAKLKLSKSRNSTLIAMLLSADGLPIPDETVKIVAGKREYFVTTDAKGKAVLSLKRQRGKLLFITARLVNNPSVSDYKMIRIS